MTTQINDILMCPKDVAEYLQVEIQTLAVWRLTKRHEIPFVKNGRFIRYRKSDIDEYISKNMVGIEKEDDF